MNEGSSAEIYGLGPLLFCRGMTGDRLQLLALVVRPSEKAPPPLEADGSKIKADILYERLGYRVMGYRFSLPAVAGTGYHLENTHYPVNAAFTDDVHIAYVSCNGQENASLERRQDNRNTMWRRLAEQHAARPLQLLFQGGDQLYADEMLSVHPLIKQWIQGDCRSVLPDDACEKLRDYLFTRYLEVYSQPDTAWLMGRVPSLAMWDDHDICDGWGSLPAEILDAPIGQTVFTIAREFFLLFQLGTTADKLAEVSLDPGGNSLTWHLQFPGFSVLAPDLRSERRPNRVMGERGWAVFREALDTAGPGQLFVLSSVPALGPRLSWIEALLLKLPHRQKYEDDLRDQWQSRAHRDEWRRFLRSLLDIHEQADRQVSVISGEIHLASRGTMKSRQGALHQFVASGIAHPPPPQSYTYLLGLLARLGENPLPDNPIRLHPLPGQRGVYTAERNYLLLERHNTQWSVCWELEYSGRTASITL